MSTFYSINSQIKLDFFKGTSKKVVYNFYFAIIYF